MSVAVDPSDPNVVLPIRLYVTPLSHMTVFPIWVQFCANELAEMASAAIAIRCFMVLLLKKRGTKGEWIILRECKVMNRHGFSIDPMGLE
jgi:hypothetical protein